MENIILSGFMGSGKSVVAKQLSKELKLALIETDELAEQKAGMSIAEIFARYGEAYFRDLESAVLNEALNIKGAVVSLGGGAVIKSDNVRLMKKHGAVILLRAKAETIYRRVKDSDARPILNSNMNVEYIENLLKKREKIYMDTADYIIDTDEMTIAQVASEIIKLLKVTNPTGF